MGVVLKARAVAMVNVDHVAGNETLHVKTVPILYKVMTEAADRSVSLVGFWNRKKLCIGNSIRKSIARAAKKRVLLPPLNHRFLFCKLGPLLYCEI